MENPGTPILGKHNSRSDGSTISKHSHTMMVISCIYDEGAFSTNNEYEAINGAPVNIQSLIEKPFI